MDVTLKAMLVEKGGGLVSDLLHTWLLRPDTKTTNETPQETPITNIVKIEPKPTVRVVNRPSAKSLVTSDKPLITNELSGNTDKEQDYRWECLTKHMGGASVLLRESYERANDNGVGEGSAEKFMEALNEHAAAEADLDAMKDISEVKDEVDKIYSGIRQFRAASWKAGIPTGGGSKDDIEAARTWNNLLLQEVYNNAKKHVGSECIQTGM